MELKREKEAVGIESKVVKDGKSRAHRRETALTDTAAGTALHHASWTRPRALRVHYEEPLSTHLSPGHRHANMLLTYTAKAGQT